MNAAGERVWRLAVAAQGQLVGKHHQHLVDLDAKVNMLSQAFNIAIAMPAYSLAASL